MQRANKLQKWLERVLPRPIFRTLKFIEFLAVDIFLQRVLGTTVLSLVYFLVLGPTSVVMRLFFPRRLTETSITPDTGWIQANGYSPDMKSSIFQS